MPYVFNHYSVTLYINVQGILLRFFWDMAITNAGKNRL